MQQKSQEQKVNLNNSKIMEKNQKNWQEMMKQQIKQKQEAQNSAKMAGGYSKRSTRRDKPHESTLTQPSYKPLNRQSFILKQVVKAQIKPVRLSEQVKDIKSSEYIIQQPRNSCTSAYKGVK